MAIQGSALLITYYHGATHALRKANIIVPGETVLSGLSGGGYTAAATSMGFTGQEQKQFCESGSVCVCVQ